MQTERQESFDRFARHLLHPYFACAHRLRWSGREKIPTHGPAVLAANHQSFYDPVMIGMLAPRHVMWLAWEYYYRMPVVGALMRLFGPVPVDVDAPAPTSLTSLLHALKRGDLVGIFPEGGRTPDGLPRRPRRGAAVLALRSGAPVVPITIAGAHAAWPVGRTLPRARPIAIHFGRPFRADAVCRQGQEDARRRAVTYHLMHRVADGFSELDHPRLARDWHARLAQMQRTSGGNPSA